MAGLPHESASGDVVLGLRHVVQTALDVCYDVQPSNINTNVAESRLKLEALIGCSWCVAVAKEKLAFQNG